MMIFGYIILLLYVPYICYLNYSKKKLNEIHSLLKYKMGGLTVFSIMINMVSPYSGSIYPTVENFNENVTQCCIEERSCLKNPFHSILL